MTFGFSVDVDRLLRAAAVSLVRCGADDQLERRMVGLCSAGRWPAGVSVSLVEDDARNLETLLKCSYALKLRRCIDPRLLYSQNNCVKRSFIFVEYDRSLSRM